ncbi:MAG: LPS export ABC transporter periplasmic protein LptC [Oceanicoccus sp.]
MKLLSSLNINRIVIATGAVAVLFYLLAYPESGMQPTTTGKADVSTKVNFYLVNDVSTQFDEQGLLELSVTAQRVRHNPGNSSVDLTNPVFQLYTDGEHQWNVSAKYGVLFQHDDRAELMQEVVIVSTDQKTSLKTPSLTIFPQKRQAQTDKPVTLLNSNGFTRAIGMKADLEKKEIALLNHVRGQYEPLVPTNNVD